jgi:hypothetical protein
MTNEALAGVVYFIVNEWYWSCYENVQAHIGGLIQMVRLRGGLDNLGANGFMRKMVILYVCVVDAQVKRGYFADEEE